jgi:hypothetical protein
MEKGLLIRYSYMYLDVGSYKQSIYGLGGCLQTHSAVADDLPFFADPYLATA